MAAPLAIAVSDTSVRQDKAGRYSLNDLHRAAGSEKRHQPSDWLRLQQTKDLIAEVEREIPGIPGIASKQGSGTFVVKELVYAYAMWVSPAFHLKVIRTFDAAVTDAVDWRKSRHSVASTNKVQAAMLQEVRAAIGKPTEAHHYMTEAKLVNWAHSGEFTGMERDGLSAADLDLLAFLELKNATLIGRGVAYADRKPLLKQYALDWRIERAQRLTAESAHA